MITSYSQRISTNHMFGIVQFITFSFIVIDAACQKATNPENFSYMSDLRLLRNDSVAGGQIFCSEDTGKHSHFALTRGRIPHLDSVIGVYRNNQQSQVCYFNNKITTGLVDVTTLTGGELYTIGNYRAVMGHHPHNSGSNI